MGFNVEWATQSAFAHGLGFNPKAYRKTTGLAIFILEQVASQWFCQVIPPEMLFDRESWRTLHPQLILDAQGAISVHGGL